MRINGMAWPLYLLAMLTFLPVGQHRAVPPLPANGIETDGQFTIQELVQDIFVRGGCKNISNIESIGNSDGIGYFENGGSSIGIDKGIVISTGPIGNAEGPNSDTDVGGDFSDGSGDRDLGKLASSKVYDAVGFEFDFVPLDSTVTFRYVFASEEYCEYVGSKFNDVFGFFVSGPGINGNFQKGGENVALIPETDDYVSINSVNHLRNEAFYKGNELEDDAITCDKPYTPTELQSLIEFDGFTTVLTATLKLIPCETYHLKLVVGDVSDRLFDSAVFLEAESFNIGGEATVASRTTIDTSYVLEGCPSGEFVFNRVDTQDISEPLEVNFLVSDASTAVEGVDFDWLPTSIIIPPNRLSATLPVNVINDLQAEDPEEIILELNYPCDCVTGNATMVIADPPGFGVSVPEVQACPGTEATLVPEISGGTAGFTYQWSTMETGSTLTVAPEVTTDYTLTVTDACGSQTTARGRVRVTEPARAEISGYQDLCPGEEGMLNVHFTGEPPWSFSYSINGEDQGAVTGVEENPYGLAVREAGAYQLTSFSDGRCEGIPAGTATVEVTMMMIEAEPKRVSCSGLSDGQVDVVVNGGDLPYAYEWNQGMGERKNLQNVPAGTYTLTVTDAKGCNAEKQVTVGSPPPIAPVTFECLDLGTDSIFFQAGGGSPPYEFSIDGSNFKGTSLFGELTPGSLYNLIIRDSKGCRLEQEFVMPANTKEYVELLSEVTITLGQSLTLDPQLLIPRSLVEEVQWTPEVDLTCIYCLQPTITPQENRAYTMRVTDRFGCWDEASIIVNVNRKPSVFIPTAFSPNNDGHNDRFMIFADTDQVKLIKNFQVFNRWGNLLYEVNNVAPNNPDSGWDGRFRGKFQDPGIYVYTARIELVNGNVLVKTGDVALMR